MQLKRGSKIIKQKNDQNSNKFQNPMAQSTNNSNSTLLLNEDQ